MQAVRLHKIVENDGEIHVTGLPCHKGQDIEMILLIEDTRSPKKQLTASELSCCGLVGLWKDRQDIQDSAVFARALREEAQQRRC